MASDEYNLYVYGGNIYVNCQGDGLDSNGGLYLYGGDITVLSQATGGDNSPFDSDGTWVISGATLFGAGTNPMRETPAAGSQPYFTQTVSRSANTVLNISYGGGVVRSEKLVRNVNYLVYSSPSMTSSSCSVATASGVMESKSNDWAHSWDSGVATKAATSTSTGVKTFTCSSCGATETQTIPLAVESGCSGHAAVEAEGDEGFAVTFDLGEGVERVDVYYTQDYSEPDETGVTSTVSRDPSMGVPDGSGSGQVNFRVVLADGYGQPSVSASKGTYKNIKNLADSGDLEGGWRITKITADTTVTISAEPVGDSGAGDSGADDPSADSVAMHRLYNPNSGEHFYTGDADEHEFLLEAGWNDEGVGWIAPSDSKTPVFRLYNPNAGDHHFTMSESERDALVDLGWTDEGVGWYSDDAKAVPLYREYNPNELSCNHNYTVSEAEHAFLVSIGWNDEGLAWYGVR